MKESILHYVWQHKLFSEKNLETTDAQPIEVIDIGKKNYDSGPDFFNAKIKIAETLWAGNVEIHTCSSDWMRHQHQKDKAYDSVILHVVLKADCKIFRMDGSEIPQLELTLPPNILKEQEKLLQGEKNAACFDKIQTIPSIFIQSWKNALLFERLEEKTEAIKTIFEKSNGHWEESFYLTLARNFGFSTNSQAFELLAKSLPLSILSKHKNNLFQLEALFFGQADLLPEERIDDYSESLKKEYNFLCSKYELHKQVEKSNWKFLRLRPINFPCVRIAQFAALIHSSSKLFSKIIEKPELSSLQQLFACEPSLYWETHYLFSEEKSKKRTKKIGVQSINTIIINTVVPFLFFHGQERNNEDLKSRALSLLEELPPENNTVTKKWEQVGLKNLSAYDSQALLQLWNKYCNEKKCLRCRIGHKVLNKK